MKCKCSLMSHDVERREDRVVQVTDEWRQGCHILKLKPFVKKKKNPVYFSFLHLHITLISSVMYVYSVHLQHNLYYCLFGLVIYTAHTHPHTHTQLKCCASRCLASSYEHNLHILRPILNENAAKRKTECESQIKT